MPTPQELETKFWKALGCDMTMMLSIDDGTNRHQRPMTAQIENDQGPIWFFAAKNTSLGQSLSSGAQQALGSFASKGHDLFASIHGTIRIDNDRAVIDRLWNPFVAAWYEGGKDDPQLLLLRLDEATAEIWLDGSSILAGIKMLLGMDPKQNYKDHVATVALA